MISAFGNRESTGIWCRIAGGKIVRSANENTPGALKVEKKRDGVGTGEYRWELHDDTVTGRLVTMRIQEQTFGTEVMRQLVVVIDFAGERINVSMKEGDRYWRAFMTRLPNVDIAKDITFAPFDFTSNDDGKRIIGMNVFQAGNKLAPKWTRDEPGQLPQMVMVKYKGKDRPDFTLQDEWLNNNVLIPTNAKLSEMVNVSAIEGPVAMDNNEEDDLPF